MRHAYYAYIKIILNFLRYYRFNE